MKSKYDLTRGWLRKGESDLIAGKHIAESEGPYDTACFHAQQAAEKFLKGFLAFHGQPIPRTHDLEELVELCIAILPMPDLTALHLEELSDFAVEIRYDFEVWPSQQTARDSLKIAEQVQTIVFANLPPKVYP